jgi:hypothetical protein
MRPDGPDQVRASLARIDAALLSVTDGALFEQGIKAKLGRTIRPTDSNIVHTERDRLATLELLGLAGLRCGSNQPPTRRGSQERNPTTSREERLIKWHHIFGSRDLVVDRAVNSSQSMA